MRGITVFDARYPVYRLNKIICMAGVSRYFGRPLSSRLLSTIDDLTKMRVAMAIRETDARGKNTLVSNDFTIRAVTAD